MISYIPKKGDIVWIDFNPQAGKEITKRRPALVISSSDYNKCGLVILCPITSKIKDRPFEVVLDSKKIEGAVLSDQVKNFDWKERKVKFVEKCNKKVFQQVLIYTTSLIIN